MKARSLTTHGGVCHDGSHRCFAGQPGDVEDFVMEVVVGDRAIVVAICSEHLRARDFDHGISIKTER
jgi:hypothetical protein